jgi:DNA-binding winged helix-turn-helix (wHTH) protein
MQPLEKEFEFEGLTLNLRRGCLRGAGGEIELRPKSFEVLRYLAETAGRLVPEDELMKAVWPHVIVIDEPLARCVSDVRLALSDRQQQIIRTVPRPPGRDSKPRFQKWRKPPGSRRMIRSNGG